MEQECDWRWIDVTYLITPFFNPYFCRVFHQGFPFCLWDTRLDDVGRVRQSHVCFEDPKVPAPRHAWYCWWKKSCTSWYVVYPIIFKVWYVPGGAGFLPPTVCFLTEGEKMRRFGEREWIEMVNMNKNTGVLYALYPDLRSCFTNHWSQPLGDYNVPRLDRENIAKKGENMLTYCGIFRSLLLDSTHLQSWVLEVYQYIIFKASPFRTTIEGRVEPSQFNAALTSSFPEQFLFKATNSQVCLLHSVRRVLQKVETTFRIELVDLICSSFGKKEDYFHPSSLLIILECLLG